MSAPSTRAVNTPKSVSQKHGYAFPRHTFFVVASLTMPFFSNVLKAVCVDLYKDLARSGGLIPELIWLIV